MNEKNSPQIADTGEIQDAEVVEETASSPDQSTVFLSLESLIKNHLQSINRIQHEYNEQKELLDSVLENDATYREHTERVREATKVKNATKQEIIKRPNVLTTHNKVKSLRAELGEQKATLAELLEEFRRTTGSNQIDNNGEILEIVTTAKLVKRSG